MINSIFSRQKNYFLLKLYKNVANISEQLSIKDSNLKHGVSHKNNAAFYCAVLTQFNFSKIIRYIFCDTHTLTIYQILIQIHHSFVT